MKNVTEYNKYYDLTLEHILEEYGDTVSQRELRFITDISVSIAEKIAEENGDYKTRINKTDTYLYLINSKDYIEFIPSVTAFNEYFKFQGYNTRKEDTYYLTDSIDDMYDFIEDNYTREERKKIIGNSLEYGFKVNEYYTNYFLLDPYGYYNAGICIKAYEHVYDVYDYLDIENEILEFITETINKNPEKMKDYTDDYCDVYSMIENIDIVIESMNYYSSLKDKEHE